MNGKSAKKSAKKINMNRKSAKKSAKKETWTEKVLKKVLINLEKNMVGKSAKKS